jgi:hypothetical protein
MLTPDPRTWGLPALTDLPTRLTAVGAGHGPTPNPSPSGGVVRRWLTDPAGVERRLLTGMDAAVSGWWATWHLVVLAAVVAAVAARVVLAGLRARAWRRARDRGRWLAVVPPPTTTTKQGQKLWAGLVGLARPGRLGRHLRLIGWEVHADDQRLTAGLWLPATIDAGQTARAVTATYPRARVRAGERGQFAAPTGLTAPHPAPATAWSRLVRRRGGAEPRAPGPASAGYLAVPAAMWAPLLHDPSHGGAQGGDGTADGLRNAYSALAHTPAGYRAVLQILTRPLPPGTARAARRVCRAAGGPPGPGLPARGLLALLDLATAALRAGLDLAVSGPPTSPAARRALASRAGAGVDVVTAQRHREALVKASGGLVEVCVRVVVSGPDRAVCQALAFEIVNGLQVATTQQVHVIRLRHAHPTVAGRDQGNWRAVGPLAAGAGHRRGWFVATPTELGGLARFPHQPAVHRFDAATAPHLPVPTGIPVLPTPTPTTATATTTTGTGATSTTGRPHEPDQLRSAAGAWAAAGRGR